MKIIMKAVITLAALAHGTGAMSEFEGNTTSASSLRGGGDDNNRVSRSLVGHGEGCHLFQWCDSGLSCQPFVQKCYNVPRRYDEPCSLGYECGDGLSCQPGVHKCFHYPRRESEPCVLGHPCGPGLTCEAFTHVCRAMGKINDVCHATRPCGDGLTCTAGRCVPLQCMIEAFEAVANSYDLAGIADQLATNDWLNNQAPINRGRLLSPVGGQLFDNGDGYTNNMNYEAATDFCENRGFDRLCTADEYRTLVNCGSTYCEGDSWAPIHDAANEYMQIGGSCHTNLLGTSQNCYVHSDLNGYGTPSWATSGSPLNYRKEVCCHNDEGNDGKVELVQGSAAVLEDTFLACSSRYPYGSGRRSLKESAPLTVYLGASADVGLVGKGVFSAAYAFQDLGVLVGSLNALCWGVGLQALAGTGFTMGIVFTDDVNKLSGNSQGIDFDIQPVAGGGMGLQVAGDGTVAVEFGLGLGLGGNLASYTNCETTFRGV